MKSPHFIFFFFGCAKRVVALIVNTAVSFRRCVSLEQTCRLERSLSLSHLHLTSADVSPPTSPMENRPDGHGVCMERIWVYSTLSSFFAQGSEK